MKLSMQILLTFLLPLLVVAKGTTFDDANFCYSPIKTLCFPVGPEEQGIDIKSLGVDTEATCTARYGGFTKDENAMVENVMVEHAITLVNNHLRASMEYLLVAYNYVQWNNNRQGLHKFFTKHSDDSWEDAISLMQHIVQRGSRPTIAVDELMTEPFPKNKYRNFTVASDLENLSWALEREKSLVNATFDVVKSAHLHHDPEFVHFLSEQLSDKHVMRVKSLSNHVNTLHKVLHEHRGGELKKDNTLDHAFAGYLYDQILNKMY